MRTTPMRWAALLLLALTGMAAAEEARIELRAYRVSGPVSGARWKAMRQQWNDKDLVRTGMLYEAVQLGDLVAGGLSLHMEGDTLQWVGESTADHPHVLAFSEVVARNRERVTLHLDYPRLAFTRRADGSFAAEMVERGEEFTLTPQLKWQDEELAAIRLWLEPAAQGREALTMPGDEVSRTTVSGPFPTAVWTNQTIKAKQDAWTGVVFEAGEPSERYLFVFAKARGDAPPLESVTPPQTVKPPQTAYTVRALFFKTNNVTRGRALAAEHLVPWPNAVSQEGSLALYALGGDPATPHADRATAFLEALEAECALELLSGPRVTTTAPPVQGEDAPPAKVVVRNAGPSRDAGTRGSGDGIMDIDGTLRNMHPLLAQSFQEIVQAGKKPAVIMDLATGFYSPETLAEGVRGVEILGEGGSPVLRVSTGAALAVGVAATETEGVVDVDLCAVHRVKDAPVRGHWPRKKRLPISFPAAASAVHYRHDLSKHPVYLAGPGAEEDTYLLIQIDIDIPPRSAAASPR